MGSMNLKTSWVMFALALAAAVSAPVPAAARHPVAAAAPVAAPAPAGNGRCIDDQAADPKNPPTFRTVPAGAGSSGQPADVAAPRMNLLNMVR